MGAPIVVKKKNIDEITSADVEALHDKFVIEMVRLFERTKGKYGWDESCHLEVL